jgi:hypothetical protein
MRNNTYLVRGHLKTLMMLILMGFLFPCSGQTSTDNLPQSGLNVFWGDFSYFTSALPFTNAMKNSSGFRYGSNIDQLVQETDRFGYPTAVNDEEGLVNLIFLETTHYPTGAYTFSWEGSGRMTLQTCDETYEWDENSPQTQTINIENACEGGIILTLFSTSSEDHVRNLRLFLPGYDEQSGYWTQNYIDYFAQFGLVRFAWGSGMYSSMRQWDERKELDDLTWAAGDEFAEGIPYEAMIALANASDTDLWVCVPPRADDNFEIQMATLLRDQLSQNHRVWIEWGNEQWNCGQWGYEGCEYLCEISQNCGENHDPNYDGPTHPQIYAQEVAQTTANFIAVFERERVRHRLVNILGAQQDNSWQLQSAVDELVRIGSMDNIDVFSTNAYFYHGSSFDPITPVLDQGMDAIMVAVSEIMENLFDPTSDAGNEFQQTFAIASAYEKPVVAYEGGQHFTGWVGIPTETVAAINRHPRLYDIYRQYFENWSRLSSGTFVHYSSYGNYDNNEAFGLQEYYNQPVSESHKLRAALDWELGIPFSPTTVLSSSKLQTEIQIYPNPTSQVLYLQMPGTEHCIEVVIHAADGSKVLHNLLDPTSETQINVGHLKQGLYHVRLRSGKHDFHKKLIVR